MIFRLLGLVFFIGSCSAINAQINLLQYEDEIDLLLNSMSLEEKVGQTCQITLDAVLEKDSVGNQLMPISVNVNKLNEAINEYKVGSILNVGWCTLSREDWKSVHKEIHKSYLNGDTKIPVIYGIDAIHGNNYTVGATLFPQEIGLAATWNRDLVFEFAQVSAYESRASGIPWNFSPVLDIGRQPLWSRHFETLGEDPYLAAELGVELVNGYQGGSMNKVDSVHVAACLKHFVGYSGTKSGRDRTPAWIPKKYMNELFLPPFEKSIKEGALTVMVNSGDVNGLPGHANTYLLNDILKGEWGFLGFTVSDWEDFIMLNTVHSVEDNLEDAYVRAFNSGVDMSMVPLSPQYKHYCESLVSAVLSGKIDEERLDDAVRRILRVKFALDLFDNTISDQEFNRFNAKESMELAKETAIQSITLLENNGILPLAGDEKVLIAGPTSNDLIYLNGAWTHTWQGDNGSFNTTGRNTIYDVFKHRLGEKCEFSQGAELYKNNHFEETRFADTVDFNNKLDDADVAVICLGEYPSTEKPGDIHSLNLAPEQLELVKIARRKNKPVVLVLLEGRPRIIRDVVPFCSAIIQCYLPGDYGADALIELIYGDDNFSGKLPYTYPKYDGIIEFYDHPKSVARDNNGGFDAFDPQWEFGHGLSYTNFNYSDFTLSSDTLISGDSLLVSVNVTNSGDFPGKETVMLFLRDCIASTVPPGKRLKRFNKLHLEPGESQRVTFVLNKKDLYFCDFNGDHVLEPGFFEVSIGSLTKTFNFNNSDDQ